MEDQTDITGEIEEEIHDETTEIDTDKPKKKEKKDKDKGAGRGIETMFRTSLRNHIQLSQIADGKANIMLSINSIIISVVLSFLFPRFDQNPILVLPTSVLILVCVSALVFSIISTIPKVTRGVFTKEEIRDKTANLLFFGNFYKMDLEDFEWGINEMMKDKEFLYGAMIRDFYNLGKVLSFKFKYLRISYIVFMLGVIFSVLVFAAAFVFKIKV
jgi:hypothetical protein